MRVFIDTGGFAALYNERDERHAQGKALWNRFAQERAQLFTSNYIVAETVNLLRVRAGHRACVRFGEGVFSSAAVRIIRVAELHEMKAWDIFKKYADQDFSFTDCTSLALMRDLGIASALAFDHHFRVMGFDLPQI